MSRQLNLDRDKIDHCFELASHIVSQAAKYIDRHSTVGIEAATLLAMGVEGEHQGRSIASLLVESLTRDQLRLGAAAWWGRALLAGGGTTDNGQRTTDQKQRELAEGIIKGKIKWEELPEAHPSEIKKETQRLIEAAFQNWTKIYASLPPFRMTFSNSRPRLGFRFAESKPKRLLSFMQEIPKESDSFSVLRLLSPNDEDLKPILENLKRDDSILALEGLAMPERMILALDKGVQGMELDGFYPFIQKEIAPERSLTDFNFSLSLCARRGIYLLSPPSYLRTDGQADRSLFGKDDPFVRSAVGFPPRSNCPGAALERNFFPIVFVVPAIFRRRSFSDLGRCFCRVGCGGMAQPLPLAAGRSPAERNGGDSKRVFAQHLWKGGAAEPSPFRSNLEAVEKNSSFDTLEIFRRECPNGKGGGFPEVVSLF